MSNNGSRVGEFNSCSAESGGTVAFIGGVGGPQSWSVLILDVRGAPQVEASPRIGAPFQTKTPISGDAHR